MKKLIFIVFLIFSFVAGQQQIGEKPREYTDILINYQITPDGIGVALFRINGKEYNCVFAIGYPDGTFRQNQPALRGDVSLMIWRLSQCLNKIFEEISISQNVPQNFPEFDAKVVLIPFGENPRVERSGNTFIFFLPEGKPGKDGRDGKDGKDGKDGRNINSVDVIQVPFGEKPRAELNDEKLVLFLPEGKPGKDGRDGRDGRDVEKTTNVHIPAWTTSFTTSFAPQRGSFSIASSICRENMLVILGLCARADGGSIIGDRLRDWIFSLGATATLPMDEAKIQAYFGLGRGINLPSELNNLGVFSISLEYPLMRNFSLYIEQVSFFIFNPDNTTLNKVAFGIKLR